jgi:hypothetical protein
LTDNWTIESGPWQTATHQSRTFLTDNWGGSGFYAPGADVAIRTTESISIPSEKSTWLLFDQSLYTEWDHDFVYVSASIDMDEWTTLYTEAGKHDEWHQLLIDLSDFAGQDIYLQFRLIDDTNDNAAIFELTDPGWSIANLRVISGKPVSTVDEYLYKPMISLNQNFPNPFNPETTIGFNVTGSGDSSYHTVSISIYNVRGQRVRTLVSAEFPSGEYSVTWNGRDDNGVSVGSGIYLYRLTSSDLVRTRKMILIK